MISLQNYGKVWLMMVDTTAKTAAYAFDVGAEAQVRVELEIIVVKVVDWAEEEGLEH